MQATTQTLVGILRHGARFLEVLRLHKIVGTLPETNILLMEEILHQLGRWFFPWLYKVFVKLRWCRISSINSSTWKWMVGRWSSFLFGVQGSFLQVRFLLVSGSVQKFLCSEVEIQKTSPPTWREKKKHNIHKSPTLEVWSGDSFFTSWQAKYFRALFGVFLSKVFTQTYHESSVPVQSYFP